LYRPVRAAVARPIVRGDLTSVQPASGDTSHLAAACQLEYHRCGMAKKENAFEVGCPCCGALIKVDTATEAVIAHTPPARPKTFLGSDGAGAGPRLRRL